MLDLTVIILTYNEELHIRRCLENVTTIAKQIFVIDCFSTDKTVEIAESLGANVVQHHWPGNQAEQFNWALDNLPITTQWILRLDADEYLMPELVQELQEKLPSLPDDVSGVILKRRHIFLGKWMRRGVYPVKLLRIFRHGKGMCEQRLMDEQILLQDTPGGTKFFIHTVKDNKSGSIGDRITPGGIVFIYGQQLLMNGDLPERGVYLLRADTMDVACHLTPDTFALCTRGRIALQLPADLAPGQYRLKVVSQCSTSPKPLKKARAYLWPGVLTVQHENEE